MILLKICSDSQASENPDLDPGNMTQPGNAFHPLYENQMDILTQQAHAVVRDASENAIKEVRFTICYTL